MNSSYYKKLRFLLIPYASGILLFVALPAVISLSLAFFEYDGLSRPEWVGNRSLILAYTDELFNLSVQNAVALVILPVPLRIFGTFITAYLLRGGGRGLAWLRTLVYLPTVIPATAYALAWLWILNPLFGPLNTLLKAAGLLPPGWFSDPLWAKPALILMSLWQIGEGFLVSLAALKDVPPELEESARLDGASSWQVLWKIMLPILSPILLLLAFRDAILTLQESFTTILITTQGGPYYATYTLPLFVYEQAFDLLSFGVASAAMWALYLLAGLIVLALYLTARSWNIGVTDETLVF